MSGGYRENAMPNDEIKIERPPFWQRVREWEPSNATLWLSCSIPIALGASLVDGSAMKFVVMRVVACFAIIPGLKLIGRAAAWFT